MKKAKKEFGKHYLVEFIGCAPEKIKYVRDVKKVFLHAAAASGAKAIDSIFHQFKPCGVTGVILIEWSHFFLHTWPEDGYVAFDVFTCGRMDAGIAVRELKKSFCARRTKMRVLSRGF